MGTATTTGTTGDTTTAARGTAAPTTYGGTPTTRDGGNSCSETNKASASVSDQLYAMRIIFPLNLFCSTDVLYVFNKCVAFMNGLLLNICDLFGSS